MGGDYDIELSYCILILNIYIILVDMFNIVLALFEVNAMFLLSTFVFGSVSLHFVCFLVAPARVNHHIYSWFAGSH